jgi:hypothetical protein
MSVVTTFSSLLRPAGPAVVKWIAGNGAESRRHFETPGEAVSFAMEFSEGQRPTVRIEFDTGEAACFPEIAHLAD